MANNYKRRERQKRNARTLCEWLRGVDIGRGKEVIKYMSDIQSNLDKGDAHTAIAPISVLPIDVLSNKEFETRRSVLKAAHSIDMISAMGMSRKDRRRLGAKNGVKIVGSTKPYANSKKDR